MRNNNKKFFLLFLWFLFVSMSWAQQGKDIRDVKSTLSVMFFVTKSFWFKFFLIALLLLLLGLLIWWFLKKWLAKDVVVEDDGPKTPWDRAYKKSNVLLAKGYPEHGAYKIFYSELSDILRVYMEERFTIHAPDMTTEEFLIFLNSRDVLSVAQKEDLKSFLTACDMVKFAKNSSNFEECDKSFALMKKIIDETKIVETQTESSS